VHARCLERWRKPKFLRQCNCVVMDAWNIKEDFAAAHAGQQSRQNCLGRGAVVGHQRTDLAALPAWTDHAPASKAAVAHDSATDGQGGSERGAEECGSRGGEHCGVVCCEDGDGDLMERDDPGMGRVGGRAYPAVTDIGVSKLEPGLPVVLLLRHDAVES